MSNLQSVDPALDVLLRARDLLSDASHWTKYAFLTDAGAYCMLGALAKAAGGVREESELVLPMGPSFEGAKRFVEKQIGHPSIASFNDDYTTTHVDVLRVLDAAIADCIAKAAA